jgi:hypothetical protein
VTFLRTTIVYIVVFTCSGITRIIITLSPPPPLAAALPVLLFVIKPLPGVPQGSAIDLTSD